MRSKRKDGLGHWPKGKRRNPDRGNWSRVRLLLAQLLEAHGTIGGAVGPAGRVSKRELGRVVGVDVRTVGRWIDGTHRPDEETQAAVSEWVAEKRKAIKSALR